MSGSIAGFGFATGDASHEVQTLALHANRERIPRRFFGAARDVPADWTPCGSVEWVCQVLGRELTPEYYPDFLSSWLHRRVWRQDQWPVAPSFCKPADRFKRFNGFVFNGDAPFESGPLWCSELVSFRDEWRFYVARGQLLAAHWYAGDNNLTPAAPRIDIAWPAGWCGAADFGQLADGRLALVESHAPIACGWYGRLSDGAVFADWLSAGWDWARNPRRG